MAYYSYVTRDWTANQAFSPLVSRAKDRMPRKALTDEDGLKLGLLVSLEHGGYPEWSCYSLAAWDSSGIAGWGSSQKPGIKMVAHVAPLPAAALGTFAKVHHEIT